MLMNKLLLPRTLSAFVIVPVLFTLSFSAQAASMSQPNYSYFSGGISEYSNDMRGVSLYGQYELQNKFFLIGNYEQVTNRNSAGTRFSQTIAEIGGGRYFTILDGTTIDVSATTGRLAASQNVFNSGDNFYTLNTGINHRRGAWESRIGYRYVDFSGQNADHGVVASLFFYAAPQVAVGVQFNDVYGRSSASFGVRFIF
ncbi:hypothetical protein A28LD_2084 [Idiomarina sp. A28L]|nr:hypothetical protein A28LD_2084 [Idiomarina sp. A28L]